MKAFLGWCLVTVFAISLSGCATKTVKSTPNHAETAASQPLPWADQSQGKAPGEVWFVGNGISRVEAEARHKAEASAESLYVRFLGADVLVSEQAVTATTTDERGINVDSSETKQYSALSSSAFVSEARFEYSTTVQPSGYSVWARMFVPDRVHRRIMLDVNTQYEARVNRLADARRKVEQTRYSKDTDHVFAMATGTAIRRLDSQQPLRSESAAVDAARMEAMIKLSEYLTGTKIDNVRLEHGGFSRAYSGGHIFHDELSTRVWVIGKEVKAAVSMLGWVSR